MTVKKGFFKFDDLIKSTRRIIPAEAGIQDRPEILDSGLRRNDESGRNDALGTFYDIVKFRSTVVVAVVILLTLAACGKKGPLVPPDRHPPTRAALLSVQSDGDRVTLEWNVAPSQDKVTGYAVYRASFPLEGPVCPVCHQQFHRIDSVTVPPHAGKMSFIQTVPKGFHYTYQVRPYNADDLLGPVSNQVEVDVPLNPPAKEGQ
jgi:predicted small lipoprotein YifL